MRNKNGLRVVLTQALIGLSVACGPGAGGDGDAGADGACLGDELDVIDAHLARVNATRELTSGHASPGESIAFLFAPGLEEGLAAEFGSLFMPCTGESEFDPYCDGTVCRRLGCTGVGAGWTVEASLESPLDQADGWHFESVVTTTTWVEETDVLLFTIESEATDADGVDWSFSSSGELTDQGWSETGTFASLHEGGAVQVSAAVEGEVASGTITVGGEEVAEVTAHDGVAPSGSCGD